jgi:hypothetical protein
MRVKSSGEASAIADSLVLNLLRELLESPETEIRRLTCWVLGRMAHHDAVAASILSIQPCPQLVSLLR